MEQDKKAMRLSMLKDLKKMALDMMGDDLHPMLKEKPDAKMVAVSVKKEPSELADKHAELGDNMEEQCESPELEAHEELEESPEHEAMESPEEEQAEMDSGEDESDEDLDAQIAALQEKKKAKASKQA